jgi:hypothetical protein
MDTAFLILSGRTLAGFGLFGLFAITLRFFHIRGVQFLVLLATGVVAAAAL